MDYWTYKDMNVVFTESEENEMLAQVESNPANQAGYKVVTVEGPNKLRDSINKKIVEKLKGQYNMDPQRFRSRFESREFYNTEAMEMFPYFINRYGQITKIATFGKNSSNFNSPFRLSSIGAYHDNDSEQIYYISLIKNKRTLFFNDYYCDNCISFPAKSIKSLIGKVTRFILTTDSMILDFYRDNVEIKVLKKV